MTAAKKLKISPMELSERIIDGAEIPRGVKPGIKSKLAEFVGVVRKLRRAAQKVLMVSMRNAMRVSEKADLKHRGPRLQI